MITITILKVKIIPGIEGGEATKNVSVLITNNGDPNKYILSVGGLPMEGNLQPILDAQADQLWNEAVNTNVIAGEVELALAAGIDWFNANPATKILFTNSIASLETEINTLVDAVIPSASAANRTKMKKMLVAFAVAIRISVIEDLGKIF